MNLKAGMRLKYMGSKSWLAPHVDRLLGDVAVLHSPFFGSGKLEYYLAARRPALEVRGVDAFKPVANLHRCYLKQDPVFLRSLLRLAGRKIHRRFYFSRLLRHSERPRRAPGRLLVRPAAQQLLEKVGLLRTAAATSGHWRWRLRWNKHQPFSPLPAPRLQCCKRYRTSFLDRANFSASAA